LVGEAAVDASSAWANCCSRNGSQLVAEFGRDGLAGQPDDAPGSAASLFVDDRRLGDELTVGLGERELETTSELLAAPAWAGQAGCGSGG
jgi:hypothetical protein